LFSCGDLERETTEGFENRGLCLWKYKAYFRAPVKQASQPDEIGKQFLRFNKKCVRAS
jgi:hypothetical protein